MIDLLTTSWGLISVLIMSVILFLVLGYLEWTRVPSHNRILRIILTFLSITSLAAVVIRPDYQTIAPTYQAILLTDHYLPETMDSLLQAKQINNIFVYPHLNSVPPEAIPAPNLAFIQRYDSLISDLHIIGEGIPSYDIPDTSTFKLSLHLTPIPQGVTAIDYISPIDLGEQLQVTGIVTKGLDTVRIQLNFAGETVDSFMLAGNQDSTFYLEHIPVNPGKYLYELVLRTSKGALIQRDSLPLVVDPDPPMSILFLQQIPNFENNYLKNWLIDRDHPLIYRVKITRNRYRTDFIGVPRQSIDELSQNLLSSMDLVIMDGASLRDLSGVEKSVLKQSITDSGLSLLILADEANLTQISSNDDRNFFLDTRWRKDDITTFKWEEGASTFSGEKLPYEFLSSGQVFPLIQTQRYTPAVWFRKGKGKIGISVITNTYVKLLQGENDRYDALWDQLLERLKPLDWNQDGWNLPLWAYQDHPLDVELRTSASNPVLTYLPYSGLETILPLMQDPLLSDHWQTRFWPSEIGWNQLSLNSDTLQQRFFYVFPDTAWQSLQLALSQSRLSALARNTQPSFSGNSANVSKEIPAWIFYLIFLSCMGGLWLERKLDN